MSLDKQLRPLTWDSYINQDQIKNVLRRALAAAKKRGESLDHLLLTGPPGLGKTSLARLTGGQDLISLMARDYEELEAGLARELESRDTNTIDFLFIDEVHALDIGSQERLAILMDKGGRGTIIAATTQPAKIIPPLRDRFPLLLRVDFYPVSALAQIIENSARALNVGMDEGASVALAKRSRGVPRIANHLLRRVRDATNQASAQDVADILTELGIDEWGIRPEEEKYLIALGVRFNGGPTGAATLAGVLSENIRTVKEIFEPFLLRLGFLEITGQGRRLTQAGKNYLRVKLGHTGSSLEDILS